MILRILQFLIGGALAVGGGYLGWLRRAEINGAFPPSAETAPWLLIAALALAIVGAVLAIGALLPRAEEDARRAAERKRQADALRIAESYYGERARSSVNIDEIAPAPLETSVPTAAPLETTISLNPAQPSLQAFDPAPLPDHVVEPPEAPADNVTEPTVEGSDEDVGGSLIEADLSPPLVPAETAATDLEPLPETEADPKPQAPLPRAHILHPTAPPPQTPFPSPIPAMPVSSLIDTELVVAEPVQAASPQPQPSETPDLPPAPEIETQAPPQSATPIAPSVTTTPVATQPAQAENTRYNNIRQAIADERLEQAEQLIVSERAQLGADGSTDRQGLAELTALAGAHAAAAGRPGEAKWLWRLSLQRFASAEAMGCPAAREVAENLRVLG